MAVRTTQRVRSARDRDGTRRIAIGAADWLPVGYRQSLLEVRWRGVTHVLTFMTGLLLDAFVSGARPPLLVPCPSPAGGFRG